MHGDISDNAQSIILSEKKSYFQVVNCNAIRANNVSWQMHVHVLSTKLNRVLTWTQLVYYPHQTMHYRPNCFQAIMHQRCSYQLKLSERLV